MQPTPPEPSGSSSVEAVLRMLAQVTGSIPRIVECVIFTPWETPYQRFRALATIALVYFLLYQLPMILHGYPPLTG